MKLFPIERAKPQSHATHRRSRQRSYRRIVVLGACGIYFTYCVAIVIAYSPVPSTNATYFSRPILATVGSSRAGMPGQKKKPESGWLYVVDSNNRERHSRVLLVDPEQGKVIRTFKAASVPDIALSPDGTRLYIASSKYGQDGNTRTDLLKVVDTATGAVIQTIGNPDRWMSTSRKYASMMALSADGRWLYVFKHKQTSSGDIFYLHVFDTIRGIWTEKRELPDCLAARLFPLPTDRELNVICSGTTDIRFVSLKKEGSAEALQNGKVGALPSRVSLWTKGAAEPGNRVGPGFVSADGGSLTVIMGDGRFFKVENNTRKLLQSGAIDGEAREKADGKPANSPSSGWLTGNWIRNQYPATNGKELFLGVGRLAHLKHGVQVFTQIAVLDAETFSHLRTIQTRFPFESLTLSKDGRYLYAVSPEQASIIVIDTVSSREVRTLYDIGTSPIMVIVAP